MNLGKGRSESERSGESETGSRAAASVAGYRMLFYRMMFDSKSRGKNVSISVPLSVTATVSE